MVKPDKILDIELEKYLNRADVHVMNVPLAETELQLKHFVVDRAGDFHPWGKYVQACRELRTRREALALLTYEIRDAELDLEEASNKAGSWWRFGVSARRWGVKAAAAYHKMLSLRASFDSTMKQLRILLLYANDLAEQLGTLTPERMRELDEEYWAHRLTFLLRQSLYSHARVQPEILTLLASCPAHIRSRVLAKFELQSFEREYLDASTSGSTAIANLPK